MNVSRARIALLGAITLALTVTSCSDRTSTDDGVSRNGRVLEMPTDVHGPNSPVWSGTSLYFTATRSNSFDVSTLWRWSSDKGVEPVEFQTSGFDCSHPSLINPFTTTANHIGVVAECDSKYALLDVDTASHSAQVLLSVDYLPAVVAWAPGLAYVAAMSQNCAGIVRVRGTSVDSLASGVRFEQRTWPLGAWILDGADDCPGTGLASWPRLVDDNKSLVLLAAPAALGMDEAGRQNAPWTVYSVPAGLGNATKLADGFQDPRGLSATTDGRNLAISATYHGKRALWLVDGSNHSTTSVSTTGDFYFPAIAPDGHAVAVVDNSGKNGPVLRIFDLTKA